MSWVDLHGQNRICCKWFHRQANFAASSGHLRKHQVAVNNRKSALKSHTFPICAFKSGRLTMKNITSRDLLCCEIWTSKLLIQLPQVWQTTSQSNLRYTAVKLMSEIKLFSHAERAHHLTEHASQVPVFIHKVEPRQVKTNLPPVD